MDSLSMTAYLLGAQSIVFELRLGGAHEVAEEKAPFAEVRDLGDVDLIELDQSLDGEPHQ